MVFILKVFYLYSKQSLLKNVVESNDKSRPR